MEKLFIGVDIGKEFHWAVAIDEEENIILSKRLENTQEKISKFLRQVAKLADKRYFGIDIPTGPAALFLAVCLEKGEKVLYVPGIVVNRERDTFKGESKTDKKDAFVIAQVIRTRRHLSLFKKTSELEASLRFLLNRLRELTSDETRAKNRLRQLLLEVFPALENSLNINTYGALVLLSGFQTPRSLKGAKEKVENFLKARKVRNAKKLAKSAYLAAKAQTISLSGESVAAPIIADLATEILSYKQKLKVVKGELSKHFFLHPQAQIITSLSGYGPILGAGLIVSLSNTNPFLNADQLASYGGVAPCAKDSGKRTGNNFRARGGNRLLKYVFCQSAFCSLKDPLSRVYYERKKSEGKTGRQALIALSRRRVNVLWAMLRDNKEYNPIFPKEVSKTEVVVA